MAIRSFSSPTGVADCHGSATLAMTVVTLGCFFCFGWALIRPGRRGHDPALQFCQNLCQSVQIVQKIQRLEQCIGAHMLR